MTPKIFVSDDPSAPKLVGIRSEEAKEVLGQLQRGVENAIVQGSYGMTPEELHEPFGAVMPEIQIKWHDSAQAIYTSHMEGFIQSVLADPEFEGITREEITEGGWVLGDESEISHAEFTAALEEIGYWGYSDDQNKVIHVWPGNLGSKGLAMLIGHEIGHLVGIKLEDDSDEEARADLYGLVAKRVVEMVQEHTPAAYRKEFIALTADVKDEREAKELWRSSWRDEYRAHIATIAAKNAEKKELQALLDREQAENARLVGEVERLQKALDGTQTNGFHVRAMKPFLAFCWRPDEARGGASDLLGRFETAEEACAELEGRFRYDRTGHDGQVYDVANGVIIANYEWCDGVVKNGRPL